MKKDCTETFDRRPENDYPRLSLRRQQATNDIWGIVCRAWVDDSSAPTIMDNGAGSVEIDKNMWVAPET